MFAIPLKLNTVLFHSGLIDEEPLRFRGEVYHGYHFSCTACGTELDSTAREVKSRPGLAANDMVRFSQNLSINQINWKNLLL